MAQFRMATDRVKRRAESLLKSAAMSKTAGAALSRNFEQEHRLQNLVKMCQAAEHYGATEGFSSYLLLDVEDARALEFF